MLRLEQLRAEVLERIERLDRRTGQMELRILRIEQRADDLAERLARLQFDVASRLDAIRDLLVGDLHIHK
jgi:chaperonin cofactor prefoldin